MKLNLEKLQQLSKPLPDIERQQMEYQIENKDWLLLSVKLSMKIRSIMAKEGISQSELARRMGVSPAQVTKIVSGQENVSLKTIAKVEAALGESLLNIDIEQKDHEVAFKERVEYVAVPVFVKSKPVERRISSAYASFNIVERIAYS